MSKIAVVFDPHCWPHKRHGGVLVKGINRRGALCLDVLRRAIDVANANDAPLIVAGDLIDSAGPVQPQFAAALRSTLAKYQNMVTLVLGNHDMTADGDHSLGVYEQDGEWVNTQVCDDIAFTFGSYLRYCALNSDDTILIPFHRDIRDERVRDVLLLVAHFGVYDDSFSSWCRRSKGAWHIDALFAFMKERNIKCCLLGDWHGRAIWQRRGDVTVRRCHRVECITELNAADGSIIFQGGALSPTGFDNTGLHGYGTVALWNTESHQLSWQELPGPRFCVARSDAEEKAIIDEAAKLGHNLFLRRYYNDDRPATPQGIEAYETVPLTVKYAAVACIDLDPKTQLEELLQDWLEQFGDDKDALEAHARRYM